MIFTFSVRYPCLSLSSNLVIGVPPLLITVCVHITILSVCTGSGAGCSLLLSLSSILGLGWGDRGRCAVLDLIRKGLGAGDEKKSSSLAAVSTLFQLLLNFQHCCFHDLPPRFVLVAVLSELFLQILPLKFPHKSNPIKQAVRSL